MNSSNRELLFSLTKKDFRIDYYKGDGHGGQKKNKTENCCRITHLASGAVGKSEEGRSKEHNKEMAFRRMLATDTFKKWHKIRVAEATGLLATVEDMVDREMRPENIRIEGQVDGKWVEIDEH